MAESARISCYFCVSSLKVLLEPRYKYVRVVLFVFVVINKNNAYTKTISYYNIAKTDPKEKDQEAQLK